jgi:hypothetical protein
VHDDFQPGPRKTAQEIARRCLILYCVALSGRSNSRGLAEWLQREDLWDDVSPAERSLLTTAEPTEQQRIYASWRWESWQVMLWSICKLATLPPFSEALKPEQLIALMPEPGSETKSFVASATLRLREEIDEQLDAAIHTHWQMRNERPKRIHKAPAMIPGVVLERQWALEWIENFDDVPWDEITLNT